jgi:hypothetical protein
MFYRGDYAILDVEDTDLTALSEPGVFLVRLKRSGTDVLGRVEFVQGDQGESEGVSLRARVTRANQSSRHRTCPLVLLSSVVASSVESRNAWPMCRRHRGEWFGCYRC